MVRFKNRYILARIRWGDKGQSGAKVERSGVYRAIRDSISENFGEFGLACVQRSLNLMYYCPVTNFCLVRAARDHCAMVKQALALATAVQRRAMYFATLAVCGTTRTLKRALLKQHRAVLAAAPEGPRRIELAKEEQNIADMEIT